MLLPCHRDVCTCFVHMLRAHALCTCFVNMLRAHASWTCFVHMLRADTMVQLSNYSHFNVSPGCQGSNIIRKIVFIKTLTWHVFPEIKTFHCDNNILNIQLVFKLITSLNSCTDWLDLNIIRKQQNQMLNNTQGIVSTEILRFCQTNPLKQQTNTW